MPLRQSLSQDADTTVVRAAGAAQTPDGGWCNAKADGVAFTSSNGGAAFLANAVVRSTWIETRGYAFLELFCKSTEPVTVRLELAEQTSGADAQEEDVGLGLGLGEEEEGEAEERERKANNVVVRVSTTLSFTRQDVEDAGCRLWRVPLLLGRLRLTFVNGPSAVAAGAFFVVATLKTASSSFGDLSISGLSISGLSASSSSVNLSDHVSFHTAANSKALLLCGAAKAVDADDSVDAVEIGALGPSNTYGGFPTLVSEPVPVALELLSTSANDTNNVGNSTGARTVAITGLRRPDSAFSETLVASLNGKTAVALQTWWRIHDVAVVTAGSSGVNAGELTVRKAAGRTPIYAVIAAGQNVGRSAIFTVPFGSALLIQQLTVSASHVGGSADQNGAVAVSVRTRDATSPNSVFREIWRATALAASQGPVLRLVHGIRVKEQHDLKCVVTGISGRGVACLLSLECLLVRIR